MKNWLFATFVLLSACAPSSQDATSDIEYSYQIIGGQRVDQKDDLAKSVVDVGGFCTGSIVSKDTILTAGHCVKGQPSIDVFFGLSYDSSKKKKISSKQLIDGRTECGRDCDIALIKLKENIPDGYKAISINFLSRPLEVGADVKAYGFGYVNDQLKQSPDALMKVDLKIWMLAPMAISTFDNNQQGIAHGDSGGPLLMLVDGKFKLIGVTSEIAGSTAFFARTDTVSAKGFILKYMPSLADTDTKSSSSK